MKPIKLGQKVRDAVSGFTGIAVARTEWMNGCTRVSVQPPCGEDGKLPESQAFDEPNLEVIGATARKNADARVGGHAMVVPRAKDPTR